MVNQRELHADTFSFHDALRAVLREDPDIVLVGELRDLETIEAALTLAETGHLVFGTLHTRNAPATIDRIADVFPSDQQERRFVSSWATPSKGSWLSNSCRSSAGRVWRPSRSYSAFLP